MHRTTRHQCRQLESQRFATTCWKYSQKRLTVNGSLRRPLLQRFSIICTKLVIPKEQFQIASNVKFAVTICTSFHTTLMTQLSNYIFNIRKITQHPCRSNRTAVRCINQSQCISKLTRTIIDYLSKINIMTYPSFIKPTYNIRQAVFKHFRTNH